MNTVAQTKWFKDNVLEGHLTRYVNKNEQVKNAEQLCYIGLEPHHRRKVTTILCTLTTEPCEEQLETITFSSQTLLEQIFNDQTQSLSGLSIAHLYLTVEGRTECSSFPWKTDSEVLFKYDFEKKKYVIEDFLRVDLK